MNDIQSTIDMTEKGEELRAQSVWLLSYVATFCWCFFYGLYWLFEIEPAGTICGLECMTHACITIMLARSKRYLLIMSLLMLCNGIGFFVISCSSPIHHGVIYYTPILILVAAQLFGTRQALYWLGFNVIALTTFFCLMNEVTFRPEFLVGIAILLGIPGCVFFCCYQAEVHYAGKTAKLVDLSRELQGKADELQILATTDSLTGLPNRYQFQNELHKRVTRSREPRPFALYLIDMDGFKEINDTMGHGVGDDVLVEIGSRLTRHCGDKASIGRLGGDEFCVVYDALDSVGDADKKAAALHSALSGSYAIAENEFSLGASVGFALYPKDSGCSKDLLAYADTAMYHAKHNKLSRAYYTPDMTERLVENRVLNDRLAHSLESNEFYLVYQPQFSLETGQITGVEALLRWTMDGAEVTPDRFIPLLEQSGRMIEVSQWVINEACQQQVAWRDRGLNLRIAINVSPLQFEDPEFVQKVLEPIERHQVNPAQIDLEITEGLLIKDVPNVVAKLEQIRAIGIQISVDDFGTGYSSLAYLRQLPIDKLKIDRAFVKDIPETDDGVIASSIILLGQVLGMRVLAEGVETEQQRDYLRQQDCGEVQGFLYCRPQHPDAIFDEYASELFASQGALEPEARSR